MGREVKTIFKSLPFVKKVRVSNVNKNESIFKAMCKPLPEVLIHVESARKTGLW